MPAEHENIEIRSEEVQEILTEVPVWLIRWGITLIFTIVLAILLLSWIIEYPDVVPAQVVLTTENPPAHLVAKNSGKIDLMVEDGQGIEAGMVVAVLENPASYQDVLAMDKAVKQYYEIIYSDDFDPYDLQLKTNYDLGNIQQAYSLFYSAVQNATRDNKFAADQRRINSARESLNSLLRIRNNLQESLKMSRSDLEDTEGIFKKNQYQVERRWIDSVAYIRSKQEFNNARRSYASVEAEISRNESEILRARNTLEELRLNTRDDSENLKNKIKEAFEALENAILSWKEIYLFESPIDGTVSLSKYWSDNQFIRSGEELLVVIPQGEDIIGRMELPIMGSGKVEVGQKVNISFDNFPSNEYGVLVGSVESISLVPREDIYSVNVKVPQVMISSYKKEIPFKQEMRGQASIITEDKKLFERIFNQLREILNRTSNR